MSRFWLNRVTGQFGIPPSRVLPGVWEASAPLVLNGMDVPAGSRLVPDDEGNWHWQAGPDSGRGTCALDAQLQEHIANSLEAIAAQIADVDHQSWRDWNRVPPLSPDLAALLDVPEWQKLLREQIGRLNEVFRNPRTRLTVVDEVVPVSRARRMAPRALNHLAQHPEHWQLKNIAGLQPLRVQAQVRDEELTLFENRVACRLIDRLMRLLDKRIEALRAVLRTLKEAEAANEFSARTDYRVAQRVCAIWGQSVERNGLVAESAPAAALLEVTDLKRHLNRAAQRPLYRAIPRRATVVSIPHVTNLFRDDRNYQVVYELWHTLDRDELKQHLGPGDDAKRRQRIAAAADSFLMLCVLRAFAQDRFELPSDAPVTRNRRITLKKAGSSEQIVGLTWQNNGTVALDCDVVDARLQLVAIAARPHGDFEQIHTLVGNNVVVHFSPTDDPSLSSTGNLATMLDRGPLDPPNREGISLCSVSVSPMSLGSVERIARVIRQWLWRGLAQKYPPVFESTRQLSWLHASGKKSIAPRPLTRGDRHRCAKELHLAEAEVTDLTNKLESAEVQAQRGRQDTRLVAEANRVKSAAKAARTSATQKRDELKKLFEFAKSADKFYALAASCPVCGENEGVDFNPRENCLEFSATCPECESPWGTRWLACDHALAWLKPCGRDAPREFDDVADLGRYALAWADAGGYVCPECHLVI